MYGPTRHKTLDAGMERCFHAPQHTNADRNSPVVLPQTRPNRHARFHDPRPRECANTHNARDATRKPCRPRPNTGAGNRPQNKRPRDIQAQCRKRIEPHSNQATRKPPCGEDTHQQSIPCRRGATVTDGAAAHADRPSIPRKRPANANAPRGECSQRKRWPKANHSLQPQMRNQRDTAKRQIGGAHV